MYAVVGCSACQMLWVISDPGETAQCPRCRTRHQTRKLKRLYQSDDREAAREVRAAMLAERAGHADDFESVESVAAMELRLDDVGVDDDEYLTASGIDADAVAEAGDQSTGGSRSRDEIIRDALREQESPSEGDVVAYAGERGVPADAARDLLQKLVRRGDVTESRGRYRLL